LEIDLRIALGPPQPISAAAQQAVSRLWRDIAPQPSSD
jgi:hypothetical protein